MSQSIIQIQHLSKTFGGGAEAVHALEDINLDIRQGEIFGIVGFPAPGKARLCARSTCWNAPPRAVCSSMDATSRG